MSNPYFGEFGVVDIPRQHYILYPEAVVAGLAEIKFLPERIEKDFAKDCYLMFGYSPSFMRLTPDQEPGVYRLDLSPDPLSAAPAARFVGLVPQFEPDAMII